MGIKILAYNFVSEVPNLLNSIEKELNGDIFVSHSTRFIVPSHNDKFWWPDKNIDRDDLWTWDEIYRNVCEAGDVTRKKVLSPPDHLLILDSILKKVLNEYPEQVKELPGLMRTGFLGILSKDIRELLNEDVKPAQLEFNQESENASEFLLPRVYSKYLDYLEQHNLLDSAAVYTAAYEEIIKNQKWGRDLVLVFGGFLSFTHAQLELVQALCDRCKDVIILKPETNLNSNYFHDVHFQFRMKNLSTTRSTGKVDCLCVAEPGLEPEVIARKLASSPEYKNFDDVGIMIERGREAAFAETFDRYGVPYDFMSGIRINLTLPGKILSAIRHLNSRGFPTYETAMLLTQPCFAGTKFPVMKAYRAGCSGLEGWKEYLSSMLEESNGSEVFGTALLAVNSIKIFRDIMAKGGSPEKLMRGFYDFLTTEGLWLDRFTSRKIAELPELDETIRTTANAIETVGQKVLALSELLPDLGDIQNESLKNDEAYDFLERWCANTDIRAPLQISNAVRIFTGNPPVLSLFKIWIMTGVTQKSWAPHINSSPLLGEAERKKLEEKKAFLPSNSEKVAQHEALFRRLIQTGKDNTIILRPEFDEEGRPLSESPFFKNFKDSMPWTVTYEPSNGIKILTGSDRFMFDEIDAGKKIFRSPPIILKTARAVGASDIHKLLSCPFLWWQEKGANLYPQPTEITSQNEWGLMLHKFWEKVWHRYRTNMKQKFSALVSNEWKILTGSNEADDYKNFSRLVKDFRLRRKLDGIKFRVDRLGKIQNEILENLHEAGYTHEKILLEEEACLQADKDEIKFLGQCDRIEFLRAPTGERLAFIADYKEGIGEKSEEAMNKIKEREWNIDKREKFACGLQLSVYAALFARNYEAKLCGVYILGLEDGKISGSILNSEDFPEIFEIFSQHKSKKFKASIAERINEGEYAMDCAAEVLRRGQFVPEYQSDLCRLCKIKSLCRKGEFKGETLEEPEDD